MMRWTLAALAVVLVAGVAALYFILGLDGDDSDDNVLQALRGENAGQSATSTPATTPDPPKSGGNGTQEAAAGDPSKGGLELCNNTQSHIGVAFGYKDKQGWASEGWWNVDPGSCETLLTGKLIARYYYIYAVDYDNGGYWGGPAEMCTQDKLFTIRGLQDCEGRGYQKAGFFEVDTGERTHWTVNLSGQKTGEKTIQ